MALSLNPDLSVEANVQAISTELAAVKASFDADTGALAIALADIQLKASTFAATPFPTVKDEVDSSVQTKYRALMRQEILDLITALETTADTIRAYQLLSLP